MITPDDTTLVPHSANGRSSRIILPDYYRCIQPTRYLEVGDYVRVTHVEISSGNMHGIVHLQRRDRGYTHDSETFSDYFTYAPEGEELFNQQLLALMQEINEVSSDVSSMQRALAGITVHVDVQHQEAAGIDGLHALVPINDRSPQGLKRTLAQVRNIVQKKQELLAVKQVKLQAMMAEKMAVANAIIKPLQEIVAKIEEGIWTISLYLGSNEEIVSLREGRPAPAETPITLRQMVLAMDQECAVAAEQGGIDAISIDDFDEWLLERPEHLDQILPETRGVIVLVPRWDAKDYGDPWKNQAVAAANKQSYFLIRNGERLYRIATNFIVGKTLVPRRDEFLNYFYEERYNSQEHRTERIPLIPGSYAYGEAEKRADARSRHYLRVGMILQGLVDRTTVFYPLPGPIQVTSNISFEQGWIRIINDAEMALEDGHERFADWQRRINGELVAGMRIIGNFGGWSGTYNDFSRSREHGRHRRLAPETAENPSSHTLYHLEGERDDGFYFYYDRGEIYDRVDGLRGARRRASCVIKLEDRFILAYDATTVEEMEYYLRSRLDRHAYVNMFPLLKAAIRAKKAEASKEEPFRQLLAGQIVQTYAVDYETAVEAIPDLVQWYKFTNKNHRALVGDDDGKALRFIVREFAVQLREQQNRAEREQSGEFAQIVQSVLSETPQVLMTAHKVSNEYIVLLPHNDENVFVQELTVTTRGVIDQKTWRLVDSRYKRWKILHSSERWLQWNLKASRSMYLTDEEIQELGATAKALAQQKAPRTRNRWGEDLYTSLFRILAATYDRDAREFHIYYLDRGTIVPDQFYLSSKITDVRVEYDSFSWHRGVSREPVLGRVRTGDSVEWPEKELPWDAGQYRRSTSYSRTLRDRPEVVLFVDAEAIATVMEERAAYLAAMNECHRLQHIVWRAESSLRQLWLDRAEQQLYEAFLKDYGDTDLWEGHRKTIKNPEYPHTNYQGQSPKLNQVMLAYLVERGIDVDSVQFNELERVYRDMLLQSGGDHNTAIQRLDGERAMLNDLAMFTVSTIKEVEA